MFNENQISNIPYYRIDDLSIGSYGKIYIEIASVFIVKNQKYFYNFKEYYPYFNLNGNNSNMYLQTNYKYFHLLTYLISLTIMATAQAVPQS